MLTLHLSTVHVPAEGGENRADMERVLCRTGEHWPLACAEDVEFDISHERYPYLSSPLTVTLALIMTSDPRIDACGTSTTPIERLVACSSPARSLSTLALS